MKVIKSVPTKDSDLVLDRVTEILESYGSIGDFIEVTIDYNGREVWYLLRSNTYVDGQHKCCFVKFGKHRNTDNLCVDFMINDNSGSNFNEQSYRRRKFFDAGEIEKTAMAVAEIFHVYNSVYYSINTVHEAETIAEGILSKK